MLLFLPVLKLAGICFALLASLCQCAPIEGSSESNSTIVKRASALYDLWNSVPGRQIARGDSALTFTDFHGADDKWGVTYLYGCTALMISDPDFVVVAHLQEINGRGCIAINQQADVQAWIQRTLLNAVLELDPGNYTRVDIIYNRCQTSWSAAGISAVRDFLTGDAFGVDEDNIVPQGYVPTGSGTGEPNSNSPSGLAVVQWEAGVQEFTLGTLKVFFGSTAGENPLRYTVSYDNGSPVRRSR